MNAVPADYIVSEAREAQDRAGRIRMYPSGSYVRPTDLRLGDIDIRDIAHHLSHINRFTGGTPVPYNVADHSVRVSEYFCDPEMKLAGLLHDAAEAYINDLSSPLKHSPGMEFYCELDKVISTRIFEAFGLDPALLAKVKPFDGLMFQREAAAFFGQKRSSTLFATRSPPASRIAFLQVFRWCRPSWRGTTGGVSI